MNERPIAFDRPSSPFYVRPLLRKLWSTSMAAFFALAVWMDDKSWQGLLLMLLVLPSLVYTICKCTFGSTISRDPIDFVRRQKGSRNPFLLLLRVIHDSLRFSIAHKLRVTLFLPCFETHTLHQVARHCSDGTTTPTDTVIRMGTGDVGEAFTRSQIVRIDDVTALGGFVQALRAFDVEEDEAKAHHDQERKSFYSHPILADDSRGRRIRLGVLSLDSLEPNAFRDPHVRDSLRNTLPTLARQIHDWSIRVG